MDRYDEAIAHFCKYPEEIEFAYQFPGDHPHGCLFLNAAKEPYLYRKVDNEDSGHWLRDPISIRGSKKYVAGEEWVTEAIREDAQLPSSIQECGLQHLPRLAYWQRAIDQMFDRKIKDYKPEPVEEPVPEEREEVIEEPEEEVPDPLLIHGGKECQTSDSTNTEISSQPSEEAESKPQEQSTGLDVSTPNS